MNFSMADVKYPCPAQQRIGVSFLVLLLGFARHPFRTMD